MELMERGMPKHKPWRVCFLPQLPHLQGKDEHAYETLPRSGTRAVDDLLERIALVKAKWGMVELVEQLLGESVPSSHKIRSPFNDADNDPSCHIYPDSFYCYSTGKYGDVVDLIRQVKHCTVERAVQILEAEADDLGLEATVRTVAPKPAFVMPPLNWSSNQWQPMLPGVSDEIHKRLWDSRRVGLHYGDLAIIHYDPYNTVIGIKYRHGDGKKTSEPGSDFSSYLYEPFPYYTNSDFCVITEGETDSWAWLSVRPDDHVYSLPSGAQSWKDKFLDQLRRYDTVYIAMDHDDAGLRARDRVTRAVGWGRANHVQFPGTYKDIREAVATGWRPTLKPSTGK